MHKSQLICFRDKMCKNLVYVLILQFKGSCLFQLQIFTPTYIVFGPGELTPMKWAVLKSLYVTLKDTSKYFTPS